MNNEKKVGCFIRRLEQYCKEKRTIMILSGSVEGGAIQGVVLDVTKDDVEIRIIYQTEPKPLTISNPKIELRNQLEEQTELETEENDLKSSILYLKHEHISGIEVSDD